MCKAYTSMFTFLIPEYFSHYFWHMKVSLDGSIKNSVQIFSLKNATEVTVCLNWKSFERVALRHTDSQAFPGT